MRNLKVYPKMASIALAGGILLCSLPLCGASLYLREKINTNQKEKVIESQNLPVIEQVCDVEGEDFRLDIQYEFDTFTKEKFEIAKDKSLFLHISLKDLEEGTKIYVRNLSVDTKLVSENRELDGFVQANSYHGKEGWQYGYPLYPSENALFYTEIDSDNELFSRVMNSILPLFVASEKSEGYSEEEYNEAGIWGNEFLVKVGLMIEKDENEPYYKEVISSIKVPSYLTQKEILKEENKIKIK